MSITTLAPPPSRSSGTIVLSFGLTAIPLSVFTGTNDMRVTRREFLAADPSVEIGRVPMRRDTGVAVDSTDIVKMAEASNGTWVELGDDEIAAATLPKGTAEIVSFVPNAERHRYVTDDVRQVRPKSTNGKTIAPIARSFGLLLTAMADRQVSALIRFVQRGPARYGLLDSDGFLFVLYPSDAVREALPLEAGSFTDKELDLAGQLIDTVGVDAPTLLDGTATQVQTYVDGKAGGAQAHNPPAPTASDLTDALAASIAAVKASKPKPARKARTRKAA